MSKRQKNRDRKYLNMYTPFLDVSLWVAHTDLYIGSAECSDVLYYCPDYCHYFYHVTSLVFTWWYTESVIQVKLCHSSFHLGGKIQTASCVSDCTVMEDGDYQACDTCTGFVTCSSSRLIRQTCGPWGQKWDDNLKECVWESETCSK